MNEDTAVLHILPDGRMVLSAPGFTAEEAETLRAAWAGWRSGDAEVLVINRRVEVVVHKP